MSDLVKNLRNPDWVKDWFDQAGFQAADRIEELEAKLAEEQRISTLRKNTIELDLIPSLSDAQARVAELEAECWRMKEDRDRAIGWRDSDQARADAAEAELFELKNAPISFLLDHGKGE